MNKAQITEVIIQYLKTHKGVSFVELERLFRDYGYDYKGRKGLFAEYPNTILWLGWNNEAADIIKELLTRGLLMTPADPLIYYIDGDCLDFPIAQLSRSYKTPHWLPVEMNWKS